MKNMKRISNVALTLVIGIMIIFPTLTVADTQQETYGMDRTGGTEDVKNTYSKEIAAKIIEKIARREATNDQLEILKSTKVKLDVTKLEVFNVKVANKRSGEIYGITVDSYGNEVDKNEIEKQEESAYRKKYGKKTIELYNELNRNRDTDKIKVGIWLSDNENSGTNKGRDSKPYIESIIKDKGKILYKSEYAPLIYAELTKKDIKELEMLDNVEIIDKEGIAKPEINSAIPTIRANLVWNYTKGSGIKVAVVEDDGIAFANPYIKDGIYYKPGIPNIDFHATAVAGVIGSTHSTYKGVAPGVSFLSANSLDYYESSLIGASDWALRNGANILSLSWGIYYGDRNLHVMDRYYDYIAAKDPYPTIVKSAGNRGGEDGRITSPGNAWNIITTGAIDDKNTATWTYDTMAWYSSYVDPSSPNNDREKPEVAAVGSRIISTKETYPWIEYVEYDGTSFAGPAVAGEAALLMSKNTALKNKPEAIRSVIFASAVHNVEGSSRLSEKDGMGAIVVNEAYKVVANNQFKHSIINSTMIYPIRYKFYASANKKVRVAIAWNSKSTGPYGTDSLKVDLDMRVKNPSGVVVGSSLSHDNNYEIVEFKSPVSGTYTVEISKLRWDSGYPSERLGYAYSIT